MVYMKANLVVAKEMAEVSIYPKATNGLYDFIDKSGNQFSICFNLPEGNEWFICYTTTVSNFTNEKVSIYPKATNGLYEIIALVKVVVEPSFQFTRRQRMVYMLKTG